MTHPNERPAIAALAALIILQALMLAALYTQTAPHPPLRVAPFAIAPFLAVSLATCAAALIIGPATRAGAGLTVLAAVFALVSFGPQKYVDAQFALIWPAVIAGQVAAVTLLLRALAVWRPRAT